MSGSRSAGRITGDTRTTTCRSGASSRLRSSVGPSRPCRRLPRLSGAPHSLHGVRPDAYELRLGQRGARPASRSTPARSQFHVRDASDEQIGPDSTRAAVAALDFARVNPVSGPVFVEGARARRHARGRDPRVPPARLGLDGDHPRLRPARRRVPRPWLRISESTPSAGGSSSRRHRAAVRPFPGTIGVAPARAGRALDRAAVAAGAATSTSGTSGRHDALPARRRRGRALLARRHACRAGRRRGLRHGDRDRRWTSAAARRRKDCARRAAVRAGARAANGADDLPRVHRRRRPTSWRPSRDAVARP